ncbi:hypothetical protein CBR_g38199 [Chara braunii]|uniref:ORM1-like protein 3 n=1 Tax=Chara braunii TaxID=69332 RepID=A0A388LPG9_CHABU|nr:hypothetical protein CBR_g38199 [Chara braunii]|eukprot:GBG84227.1 hypothetical protein CBR_g38199 [Chara braunii]
MNNLRVHSVSPSTTTPVAPPIATRGGEQQAVPRVRTGLNNHRVGDGSRSLSITAFSSGVSSPTRFLAASSASFKAGGPFVNVDLPAETNKNTSWTQYPGVWTSYIMIVLFSFWLVLAALQCDIGTAWNVVHSIHFAVTFYLFHWKKGSPFAEDQGAYDKLTWWEQMDSGRQLTRNKKFFTVLPVALYLFCVPLLEEDAELGSRV